MTRPSDIPQDVWDAAGDYIGVRALDGLSAIERTEGQAAIARAMLAERERCAAKCDARAGLHKAACALAPDTQTADARARDYAEASGCAAAIRKGAA